MIELAQHIEVLLLENDCVIVPGLGGFVAHYTPATRVAEENLFLPPTRIIGFNPQLKMNDGLLVQSYMAVYGTNFSDATKMVNKKVQELFATLHEDGKADLPNVGGLRYSIHGTYDFIPYDNKITTPYLYGLGSFEMRELTELKKASVEKLIPFVPVVGEQEKRTSRMIHFNRSYLANAAAMIAVVALFFFLSTPIENTEVVEGNYAQLLPEELFEKIEKQSLAINPIVIRQSNKMASAKKKVIVPVAVREVKVGRPAAVATTVASTVTPNAAATSKKEAKPEAAPATSSKAYHIIIASLVTEKDANALTKELTQKGFANAKTLVGDGKIRVSIQSCATEAEAYAALNKIRQQEAYQNSWVLKK